MTSITELLDLEREESASTVSEPSPSDAASENLATAADPFAVAMIGPSSREASTQSSIGASAGAAILTESAMAALEELYRYSQYEPGWDGYRGMKFDQGVIHKARQTVRAIHRCFLVEDITPSLLTTGPASDGSVDVEVRAENRTLFYTFYPGSIQIAAAEGSRHQEISFGEADRRPPLEWWLDWMVGKAGLPISRDQDQRNP